MCKKKKEEKRRKALLKEAKEAKTQKQVWEVINRERKKR